MAGTLLSFFRTIFHPELRSGSIAIFHVFFFFLSEELDFCHGDWCGHYFLELDLKPNRVIMSVNASLRCFPKR